MRLLCRIGVPLLLGWVAQGVNTCVDTSNSARCTIDSNASLSLESCGLTDADLGDIRTCLVAAGTSAIVILYLDSNDLTSLEGGTLDGLTSLGALWLPFNGLATLPSNVFSDLSSLTTLVLNDNLLSALPSDIFAALTSLTSLFLNSNALTTVPADLFESLTVLESLSIFDNGGLTCLPDIPSSVIGSISRSNTEIVTVGACDCTPTEAIFCDVGLSCQPGETGYTCVTATPAPTSPPSISPTPGPTIPPSPVPTPAPVPPTPAPTPVPTTPPSPSRPAPTPVPFSGSNREAGSLFWAITAGSFTAFFTLYY